MNGYELRLILLSQNEVYREIRIPKNINLKQLHNLIQKIFGFDDYHMWEFKVPEEIPDADEFDLNSIVKSVSCSDAKNVGLDELLDEYTVLLYEYDFGDSWEIVIFKLSEIDYDNKTALITDYKGKYNPIDDMGGVFVYDEIMEAINEGEDPEYVLDEYGMSSDDLLDMDFEKKFKVGSRIRIN